LKSNYQPGSGIVFWFGDLAAVFRQAGIPIREGLYQDNGEQWRTAVAQPAQFQRNAWAIATDGDPTACAITDTPTIANLAKSARNYNGVFTYVIAVSGSIIANVNKIAAAPPVRQALCTKRAKAALSSIKNKMLRAKD